MTTQLDEGTGAEILPCPICLQRDAVSTALAEPISKLLKKLRGARRTSRRLLSELRALRQSTLTDEEEARKLQGERSELRDQHPRCDRCGLLGGDRHVGGVLSRHVLQDKKKRKTEYLCEFCEAEMYKRGPKAREASDDA